MKKGFTLVELLAVIIILAFVALVTVPIVLSLISKSDNSAARRSAENYRKAVKDTIAKENLSGNKFYPTMCDVITDGENKGYLSCSVKGSTETKLLVVKMEGTYPVRGKIEFKDSEPYSTELYYDNGNIKIYIDEKGISTLTKLN